MEQNRFKSPVFWICTVITVAYIALQKFGILDQNNITNDTVSNIGALVSVLMTIFNGMNNPTNKTGL